jgi:hypothetical protein
MPSEPALHPRGALTIQVHPDGDFAIGPSRPCRLRNSARCGCFGPAISWRVARVASDALQARRYCPRWTLMARGACEPRNSSVLSSANHIELVTMTVVSLLRIIPGGVAVDAPGMTEDGVDLIPRREPLGAPRLRTPWRSRLLAFGALNRCHSARCRNQQGCDGHLLKRFHGDTHRSQLNEHFAQTGAAISRAFLCPRNCGRSG